MSPRLRNMVLAAIGLGVVVVTFAVVLPRIANYGDVWDALQELSPIWFAAFAVAIVVNVVTFAPPWMIALPGLAFRHALLFTQASTALTYLAPGGGLVGMAGSFGLLKTWGFGSGEVARAVTLTGVWNQLSNLLLPVVAVLLLSIEGEQDAVLTTAAVVGGMVFAAATGLLVLVFWSDGFARGIGSAVQRGVNRLLGALRRERIRGWPARLVTFRGETVSLVRRRWAALTVASIVGNLAVFAILLISVRALEIGSSQLTWAEIFAGWALARALQLIPLTPGGVGPVEIGLTGILVGFGGPNARVVAAVLVYRAFTILPTVLVGAVTIAAWRWLGPGRAKGGIQEPAGNRPGG